MDTEQTKKYIIECLREAGIPVVMDKAEMERVLGEAADSAYRDKLLQKMVLSYAEGTRAPDLTPSSVSFIGKDGKEKKMYSVRFYGDRPKDYIPKKLGKAYKLMEQWPDGTLHALFAGTQETHPMNEWNWAKGFVPDEPKDKDTNFKGIQTMHLAPRFGWHMGTGVPSTHHLMGVGDVYHPVMCYPTKTGIGHPKGTKRVWVEVSYDATNDYTSVAEANPSKSEKDIRGLVPFGGYYMFQESNLSNWIVASSIRFDRVIPEKERQMILKEAGFDEELVWRKLTLRKTVKGEMTRLVNRMKKDFQQEDAAKASRLIEVVMENEQKIDRLSQSAEPTYPPASLHKMAAMAAALKVAPADKVPMLVQQFERQRADLQKDFAQAHPATKRKRLTRQEVEASREEIREGIEENPEYLDREAAGTLSVDREGRIQGFLYGNTIYLDPEQMRLDTPIHEYTHLWDRMCQEKEPELWKEGVALMKQTRLWQAVKESPFYSDIAQDENLVASEVHARLTGLQGAKLLETANGRKPLVARLKGWGKRFWSFVRGNVAQEKKDLTLEDFVKAPISDLITQQGLTRDIMDLANPEKQQETVNLLVDGLMKDGKSVNDIDEMFSSMKMQAIAHAEQLTRENTGREPIACQR